MAFDRVSNFEGVYANLHTPAVIIGGAFVLIALVLSTILILQHLQSYSKPAEQKWIIGILFMIPVYATESIISLWNAKFSIVCDISRNCYEAFALYSFWHYLVACLGGGKRVVELLDNAARKEISEKLLEEEDQEAQRQYSLGDFVFRPTVYGKYLYTVTKFGVVQYMMLKTLCAFLALLLEIFGVYGDGEFKWYYGYPYIAIVINFSQMWALYCLIKFYNATHHRLQAIKPLSKFISFKAIVFATWWQGVGIALICYFDILPKQEKVQNGLQDFLICIEMAAAAVAHVYVFSAKTYKYLPVSEHCRFASVDSKTKITVDKNGSSAVEHKEGQAVSPRTRIAKSVQDVVLGGGEHNPLAAIAFDSFAARNEMLASAQVVKDVASIISQAMEPVEKSVNKIQESLHHISLGSPRQKKPEIEANVHVTEIVEGEKSIIVTEMKVECVIQEAHAR